MCVNICIHTYGYKSTYLKKKRKEREGGRERRKKKTCKDGLSLGGAITGNYFILIVSYISQHSANLLIKEMYYHGIPSQLSKTLKQNPNYIAKLFPH